MLFIYCQIFRPEYGYLLEISKHFPMVPIMALIATVTSSVQYKLLSMLRNPITEIATINKPNISLHVRELTKLTKKGIL